MSATIPYTPTFWVQAEGPDAEESFGVRTLGEGLLYLLDPSHHGFIVIDELHPEDSQVRIWKTSEGFRVSGEFHSRNLSFDEEASLRIEWDEHPAMR
jgi:hypothetical protein